MFFSSAREYCNLLIHHLYNNTSHSTNEMMNIIVNFRDTCNHKENELICSKHSNERQVALDLGRQPWLTYQRLIIRIIIRIE